MAANSILIDTKKTLGLAEDYVVFDQEIILYINAVFATLNQLGIGPPDGYAIADSSDTWDELLGVDLRFNEVKSYVYLRVKMLFDPPSDGYVVSAYEKLIEEATWRINIVREDLLVPIVPIATHPIVIPEGSET